MPSSHLRMEEATSIIASKSITDGFGRTDIDDLDDFVLQIDENEINNEIKANGLVEDVAVNVFKQMENHKEKTIKLLKTPFETEKSMNCKTNSELEHRTENKDQSIVNTNINGSDEKKCSEIEAKTETQNVSDTKINNENCITNQKVLELNDAIEVKENKTPSMEKSNGTETSKWNVSVKPEPEENLESVDKELDSLLSMDVEVTSDQSNNVPEPMDVDYIPNEQPVVKMTTIEHSPSILLELQNQDDKLDSDFEANDPNKAPDSPTITMHSPQTLNELDENSSSSDGFIKEKTVKGLANKPEGETKDIMEEEFIYHKVKHIQISAQSNILKENNRLKREGDEQTRNNEQKKIKLEPNEETKDELSDKNDVQVKNESNPIESSQTNSNSDSDSESSYDSASSTGSESSDESPEINGPDFINEMNRKLINKGISPADLKEIMEGRQKLFANYFEGKPDMLINRYVLEEMIMTQLIEMISYKTDVGQLRQKCRILQSEQIRLNQLVNALKKQAENARLIIKKLIDEKTNNKNWTQTAIPLKVTRSVGLQVCTCGSMTVRSKFSEKEFKPMKSEIGASKDISSSTEKCSNAKKVGPFDNKENISSNIEKKMINRDSNTSDDVVIVSVTENDSTSSSTTTDKSNNATVKKTLEATKNGIVPADKFLRKSLSVEHANSPTLPNKTTTISNPKIMATDNSAVEKESSQTLKTDISEIIDLTDKEDNPVKKSESSSKSVPTSIPSSGVVDKSKKITNNQSSPLVAVNGIKKPSLPSSSASIKKSVDIAPAADLVNSYDHLPKYPASPKYPPNVVKPPRPILRIGKNTSGKQGIMLSWSFEGGRNPPNIEEYQLYAYQESKNSEKIKTDTWKKVGDIKALPLPMACFLTQFVEGHKYHFIVRAVDTQKRLGDFSLPGSIILHAAGQPPSAS